MPKILKQLNEQSNLKLDETNKTQLAKIGYLGDKTIVSAFCTNGKEFTLPELEDFLKSEDASVRERGLVVRDLYLRVVDQSYPMKYIAYLRPDYP